MLTPSHLCVDNIIFHVGKITWMCHLRQQCGGTNMHAKTTWLGLEVLYLFQPHTFKAHGPVPSLSALLALQAAGEAAALPVPLLLLRPLPAGARAAGTHAAGTHAAGSAAAG